MKEDVQNEELNEKKEPQTCEGKAKPSSPPNPDDIGVWSCEPGGWVWIPAS